MPDPHTGDVEILSRLVRDRDQVGDPVAAIRRADAVQRHAAEQVAAARAESAIAVRQLRRLGWTFQDIALATGLTPREVGDLARESRRRLV